jgi:hypothetical protein
MPRSAAKAVSAGHVRPRRRGRELPDQQVRRRLAIVRDGDRPDDDSRDSHSQHCDRIRSIGHNAALAVGATIALLGLFASPISGASMNPARTLGPDIVANDFTGWWVYVFGPLIGATIAVMLIGLVPGLPDKEEREAAEGGALPL